MVDLTKKPLRDGCSQKELHKIITGVWLNRNDRYSEIDINYLQKIMQKLRCFRLVVRNNVRKITIFLMDHHW